MQVQPAKIGGETEILSSKSELHRLLIISALCLDGNSTEIFFSGEPSQDVIATIDCLTAVGASIERKGSSFIVKPITTVPSDTVLICPNESGSTLRFILPVFSALGINYNVTVNGRLGKRPLSPLYELMNANGVKMSENGVYPLSVQGVLKINDIQIDGSVSSQFITGLLMALPIMGGGTLKVTGDYQSKSYVDITIGAMREFGVNVIENNSVYEVKGKYSSKNKVYADGDWSNSAFMLALGAIAGKVTVTGLDIDSYQGDKAVIDILKRFGAKITIEGNRVTAEKSNLIATDIDASNIPDLIPALSIVAAVAKGKTTVYNAERLRLKESDRIKSVVNMVNALGGNAIETADGLVIHGKKSLNGGVVDGFNDHRIVMSAAISAAVSNTPVTIIGANAVNKSYTQFFKVAQNLGLITKEI